jgi:hypothetical protein
MNTFPTVADMLTVIGVAFLIAVVLSALVGVVAQIIGRRREAEHAPVSTITQRPVHEDARTHAHAA